MEVISTPLSGALILRSKRFNDPRGFFSESYNKRCLRELGIEVEFVQDNLSFSTARRTLRGLHFQSEPLAQDKLVSILRGVALDVIVDLRQSSLTYGKHFSLKLSEADSAQLFVPVGFAHGFLTLEPNTLLAYKVSKYYSPEHDRGIRWDDARLAIDWGLMGDAPTLSARDGQLPAFDPRERYFA